MEPADGVAPDVGHNLVESLVALTSLIVVQVVLYVQEDAGAVI
jgi:hypothetical protein